MSIEVMQWVWDNAQCDGTELICLLHLADYADQDGTSWAGIPKTGRRIRRSDSIARKTLRWLGKYRFIIIEYGAGKVTSNGKTNRYTVVMVGINCKSYEELCKRLKVEPVPLLPLPIKKWGLNNNPDGKHEMSNSDTPVSFDSPPLSVLTGQGVSVLTDDPSFNPLDDPSIKEVATSATPAPNGNGNHSLSAKELARNHRWDLALVLAAHKGLGDDKAYTAQLVKLNGGVITQFATACPDATPISLKAFLDSRDPNYKLGAADTLIMRYKEWESAQAHTGKPLSIWDMQGED